MRTKSIVQIIVAVFMLFTATTALAQKWTGWRGSGGWGMESAYQRMYNPATVETLSGTVVNIDKISPMKGMHSGIHVLLKTAKETIPVHLGPDWYIERLDTKIEKGDTIDVKGSRVVISGKPVVIAAEVKKSDNVLVLRDHAGIPAWSGWRRSG